VRRQALGDIETRRTDAVFLDGLGTPSLPNPTTAGDFCRRFEEASILALQEAINRTRLKVWSQQPVSFFSQTARIDADASIVGTDGQCKQGMSPTTAPGVTARMLLLWTSSTRVRPCESAAPSGRRYTQTPVCVAARPPAWHLTVLAAAYARPNAHERSAVEKLYADSRNRTVHYSKVGEAELRGLLHDYRWLPARMSHPGEARTEGIRRSSISGSRVFEVKTSEG
jgi:hypothetical protein